MANPTLFQPTFSEEKVGKKTFHTLAFSLKKSRLTWRSFFWKKEKVGFHYCKLMR